MALAQRQSGLGSLQGLALAFFITAKDDRSGWRIQIQSDDILEFGLELGIVKEIESTGAMGFEVVGRPDPLYRRMGKTAMPSHGPATPPPASLGGTHHFVEHCLDSVDRQCLGSARPGRLLEAGKSQIQNPLTPQPHGHMAGAQLSGDLLVVFAICGKQSDAGLSHQFLWSVRRLDEAQKFGPMFSGKFESKLWTGHFQKDGTSSGF
jgi:hypothetical protein